MKKLVVLLASSIFAANVYAADAEDSKKVTVDHSKNPITGTEKTTKTVKRKSHGSKGRHDSESTTTTKEKTDGSVEKTTETKSEDSNKK
ncbi:MAG: hypothetical protein ACXVA9_01160 [Bdellovibrionales bacterium]